MNIIVNILVNFLPVLVISLIYCLKNKEIKMNTKEKKIQVLDFEKPIYEMQEKL